MSSRRVFFGRKPTISTVFVALPSSGHRGDLPLDRRPAHLPHPGADDARIAGAGWTENHPVDAGKIRTRRERKGEAVST